MSVACWRLAGVQAYKPASLHPANTLPIPHFHPAVHFSVSRLVDVSSFLLPARVPRSSPQSRLFPTLSPLQRHRETKPSTISTPRSSGPGSWRLLVLLFVSIPFLRPETLSCRVLPLASSSTFSSLSVLAASHEHRKLPLRPPHNTSRHLIKVSPKTFFSPPRVYHARRRQSRASRFPRGNGTLIHPPIHLPELLASPQHLTSPCLRSRHVRLGFVFTGRWGLP